MQSQLECTDLEECDFLGLKRITGMKLSLKVIHMEID